MSITLDDMACLLHLPTIGKLLDHGSISKDDALKLMVDYIGVEQATMMSEMKRTRGARSRFEFFKKVYTNGLLRARECSGKFMIIKLWIS
ncbi:unnamed protein product [Lathyrus oleraceus]